MKGDTMPKEKTALTHPATLKSLCPPVTCTFGPLLAIDLSESSWFSGLSTAGVPFLYWEGVIDLGAFVLDDLTWVTTEKDIQEPGNFELNYTTPQRMEFIEFVSNTPLNRDRLTEVADDWQVNDAVPGMMGSTLNFENIINAVLAEETDSPGLRYDACPKPTFRCTCSKDKLATVVRALPYNERMEMVKEKKNVKISCQFCNKQYEITIEDCIQAWNDRPTS